MDNKAIKTIGGLLTILLLLFGNPVKAQNQLIKAAGYIDVQLGRLVKPANILIEGNLIKAINPSTIPPQTTTIDLGDQILLPGLMDMHVHLDIDFSGSFDAAITKENASQGTLTGVKNARLTLLAGFTTVRNVGQVHYTKELIDVALAEASDKGWITAPRIVPSGHMISIEGGHGDLGLGLSEGLLEVGPELGIISGTDQATRAVRYQIKHGARVIKIHATAGVLSMEESVGAQQLSDAEMRAVVEEAGRHNVKVCAHAHGTEGIKAAIRAGVHSIEHGSLLDEEGIELMKKNGVFMVPTTALTTQIGGLLANMEPRMADKARYVLPLAQQNLSRAIKAGVKIANGSDTPVIKHGDNALEVIALVDRGMSPAQALQAATVNCAELLSVSDRGVIAQGLLADLIAVRANPLQDITTLKEVTFVMKDGKVYKKL